MQATLTNETANGFVTWLELQPLRVSLLLVLAASLIHLSENIIHRLPRKQIVVNIKYLLLIICNCMLLFIASSKTQFAQSISSLMLTTFAATIVGALLLILFSSLRERLDGLDIPNNWRGIPITLLTALIVVLIFTGSRSFNSYYAISLMASVAILYLLLGLVLNLILNKRIARMNSIIEQIDALLPQTQCGLCGYQGCKPYAQAIANGKAEINQCPPGGDSGIQALARLLGRKAMPLNTEHGQTKAAQVAIIVEKDCIGCTKCIQACPVDAIIGAQKKMHTVIVELCTGCELCIPPCPVDCIDLVPLKVS